MHRKYMLYVIGGKYDGAGVNAEKKSKLIVFWKTEKITLDLLFLL